MIAAAEDGESRSACPGSKPYFFYTAAEKRLLAKSFHAELFTILAFSIFFEHGHP